MKCWWKANRLWLQAVCRCVGPVVATMLLVAAI
jgi:hypothetical protein